MTKRKITKSEFSYILFTLISIVLFTLLADPISNWIGKFNLTDSSKLIIGIVLAISIAYFGKLIKII